MRWISIISKGEWLWSRYWTLSSLLGYSDSFDLLILSCPRSLNVPFYHWLCRVGGRLRETLLSLAKKREHHMGERIRKKERTEQNSTVQKERKRETRPDSCGSKRRKGRWQKEKDSNSSTMFDNGDWYVSVYVTGRHSHTENVCHYFNDIAILAADHTTRECPYSMRLPCVSHSHIVE